MRPTTMVKVAVVFVVAALVTALFGGGEGVCILSGTAPASGVLGISLGLGHVLAYFAAVVASPILLLAAAALRLREWIAARSRGAFRVGEEPRGAARSIPARPSAKSISTTSW